MKNNTEIKKLYKESLILAAYKKKEEINKGFVDKAWNYVFLF